MSKNAVNKIDIAINRLNNVKEVNTEELAEKIAEKLIDKAPVRTGALKNSIVANKGKIEMLKYGYYVSVGTSRIKPTGWIDNAIKDNLDSICKKQAEEIIKDLFK